MDFYGTIGPACGQLETLQRMVEAGMTGIRMNLSHGPLTAHADWLAMIRAAGIRQLLIDLQGPELRIGTLAEPVTLVEGSSVRLGADGIPCPAALVQAAAPGQQLLLDDGKLLVQVTQTLPGALLCTVVRGGTLQSRKSIAAPGLAVHSPALTEEDLQNLKIAKQCGVTGVMLPFVRGKADILALRSALEQADAADIRIFAKIENMAGVRALPEFQHLADEILVALIFRIYGNSSITQQGFRTCSCNLYETSLFPYDRVINVPEKSVLILMLNLCIRDGSLAYRTPVDDSGTFVDIAFFI